MTTKIVEEILTDLSAGQATADALAETLGRPIERIRSALGLLMERQEITQHQICGGALTVYRLAPRPA